MPQVQTTRTRKAPQFKSRLTELRSLTHSLAAELGYCEGARRNILYSVAGSRKASEMNETQLEVAVEWMRARIAERDLVTRPYKLESVSDAEFLEVLGMAA